MGGVMSAAAAAESPPPAPLGEMEKAKTEEPEVDYLNLPCPVKYEEMQRESIMVLKPDTFEGLRFEFNKPVSPFFSIYHGMWMGNAEVASQSNQVLKYPNSSYEFGSTVITPRMVLIGRVLTDGRMNARANYAITDDFALRLQCQITSEPHYSQGMLNLDKKGKDYQAQLQLGNNAFYGANYIQSVTPRLALGGEAFWLGHQRRSGLGVAGRFTGDKFVSTLQLATTGLVSATYVHKITEKVSFAADFLYNYTTGEVTSTVGYDYLFRQARVRGKIDSNGVVSSYLEERLNMGVNLVFSGEVDFSRKDYKFGFGLVIGE